jgi:hypothetical protein
MRRNYAEAMPSKFQCRSFQSVSRMRGQKVPRLVVPEFHVTVRQDNYPTDARIALVPLKNRMPQDIHSSQREAGGELDRSVVECVSAHERDSCECIMQQGKSSSRVQ